MPITHFQCRTCSREYSLNEAHGRCQDCGGTLRGTNSLRDQDVDHYHIRRTYAIHCRHCSALFTDGSRRAGDSCPNCGRAMSTSSFHYYSNGANFRMSPDGQVLRVNFDAFGNDAFTEPTDMTPVDVGMAETSEPEPQAEPVGHCSICSRPVYESDGHERYGEGEFVHIICHRCQNDFRHSSPMQSYSYKPRPVFHGRGKKKFGVEIECTVRSSASNNSTAKLTQAALGNLVYLKSDASIENGYGIEIVTHPMSLRYMVEKRPFDKLQGLPLNSYRNPTTGIHVHVSKRALTPLTIAKVLYFYALPHNENFINKISQRNPNEYCRKNRPPEFMKNVNKEENRGANRYRQINLTNNQTVEFRHFKGNVSPDAIYRAVQYVDAITEFCSRTKTGDLTWENFVKYISDYRNNKFGYRYGWKDLRNFIRKNRKNDGWKQAEIVF